jgi:hypothetical protein
MSFEEEWDEIDKVKEAIELCSRVGVNNIVEKDALIKKLGLGE